MDFAMLLTIVINLLTLDEIINNTFHGMFKCSDDIWVLAPSVSCLQEMLVTIEEYSIQHDLEFSTDP